MRERRAIRALDPYSKTFFFFDGAQPRGITYEALKTFEDFVNEKFKTGLLRIQVVFIPVGRDEMFSGLVEGRGDLAAGNLTITPERQALVDFSDPLMQDVREIVVTGPSAPRLARVEDLAGQQGTRPTLPQLLRESPGPERAAAKGWPEGHRHPGGRRESRGRGHPRDDERRTARHHRGRPAQGRVLGDGVRQDPGPSRSGR